MIIRQETTYRFAFDPEELDAVVGVLQWARQDLPSRALTSRVTAATIQGHLVNGKPLTHGQADDLRVWLIRYLKATYGGLDWPEPLDSIAAQLLQVLP